MDRFPTQFAHEVEQMLPTRGTHADAARFSYQQIRHKIQQLYKNNPSSCDASLCCRHSHLRKRCLLWRSYNGTTLDLTDSEDEADATLLCSFGGIVCSDVTRQGAQKGDAGPHCVSQYAFTAERGQLMCI